ncbi:MAG: hypothetical protein ACUBOA_03450 [Candidatus Loosdrechtia sp.]|uniref:hypothetical protein n=1 Tax=Candidatus Loosdrechtia sp. TaxID=3101272 RepID=UPI003A642FFB|nr:MAG: hypothetical protein QY305_07020 [Candidatus Jettenia sp. AMX2]
MDTKKNAGYIIIVVAVILVALTVLGTTFLNLTSIDFTATDNYVNAVQAEKAARAGLEYAIYTLTMDKYGTDGIAYNNNSYRYAGTATPGYDENYDAYTEEWLGTGTGKIFSNALAGNNDVDNNGDGIPDSKWIDAPFSLDRGLKAQYAILIEDAGASRINVNATGNVDPLTGTFVYGTGSTTFDIRLQNILIDENVARNVVNSGMGRCGPNGVPGNAGTTASQFQLRNPEGDDRPFDVLDAADFCFGTYTPSTVFKSRLRNIINNESLFQNVRNNLTTYSFDTLLTPVGTLTSLQLGDNYYRLNINNINNLDNNAYMDELSAQLRHCVFGEDNALADQIAVNIKDYRDEDDVITEYKGRYGLEAHPYINELFYGTKTAYHRIELINPFDRVIDIGGWKLDVDRGGTVTTYLLGTATIEPANSPGNPKYFVLGDNATGEYEEGKTLVTHLIVDNPYPLSIYDFDENDFPIPVDIYLRESLYGVIVDEAHPNAYINKFNILTLIDELIQKVIDCGIPPGPGLLAKLYDAKGDLERDPPDCDRARPNLQAFILQVDGLRGVTTPEWRACLNANAEDFINRAQTILNLCTSNPSARASIGQRRVPIIERSDNWFGERNDQTIGGPYPTFNLYNNRQLVIANNDFISLGELGHILSVGYNTRYSYTINPIYNDPDNHVDNAKLNLFTGTFTTIPEYFTVVDPRNNGIDDDGDGAVDLADTGSQAGDIDGPEIQVPGRININTAPLPVLNSLPLSVPFPVPGFESLGDCGTLTQNIVNYRQTNPFTTIYDILQVPGMDWFGADGIDNDGDGITDDKDEKDLIIRSISNLITTRSNVFAVYVTARITNASASRTLAEKKLVAIVDRSVTPVKIRYFRWVTEW